MISAQLAEFTSRANNQEISVSHASSTPKVDGVANEKCWLKADWHPLDQNWIGAMPTSKDFKGRFKLVYSRDSLYLLAEILDDKLIDARPDPLDKYWDDDCLEIFVDPDASGGPHQYSHNAWAYHIALNGNTVDFGPDSVPHIYPHCYSRYKLTKIATGHKMIWEVAIALHNSDYQDSKPFNSAFNQPDKLKKGNQIGFALAWCDADDDKGRQNFMGSVAIPGEDKNQGYKSAWVFGLAKFK